MDHIRGPYGSYRWSVWFTHVIRTVHVPVRRIFRSVRGKKLFIFQDEPFDLFHGRVCECFCYPSVVEVMDGIAHVIQHFHLM